MFENSERTDLSELGEFGLIKHIAEHFPLAGSSSLIGIGDDAAMIDAQGNPILVSTDSLLEGVDFDLIYTPLKHLGYKAVVSGISDICAMNGKPTQILVSIAMSNRFSLEAIEELYLGIKLACEKYEVDLVGGDTSSSRQGLVIHVTSIGQAVNEPVKRSGAKPSDLLVVSGDTGGAYMGLQILEREKRVFLEVKDMQPDLEPFDYIVGRQLKPEARWDVVKMLNEMGIVPTSMIDVSDGIASEIHHLGSASGVGFEIYENKLPIDPQTLQVAQDFDLNPTVVALNGGEDYELLMTISQEHFEKIKNNPDLSIIGYATEQVGKYNLITNAGNTFGIRAQGWDHFEGGTTK
jgi:thiamine-monophosphate kinase